MKVAAAVIVAILIAAGVMLVSTPAVQPVARGSAEMEGCEPVRWESVSPSQGAEVFTAEWRHCPARQVEGYSHWEPRHQYVVVTRGTNEAPVFTFEAEQVTRMEMTDFDRDGVPELLLTGEGAGTGRPLTWCVLDVSGAEPRCWPKPDINAAAEALLASDETFCCKDWMLRWEGGALVFGGGVYRKGDGNCCPSRGGAFVELHGTRRGLQIARVWRTELEVYERWMWSAHLRPE